MTPNHFHTSCTLSAKSITPDKEHAKNSKGDAMLMLCWVVVFGRCPRLRVLKCSWAIVPRMQDPKIEAMNFKWTRRWTLGYPDLNISCLTRAPPIHFRHAGGARPGYLFSLFSLACGLESEFPAGDELLTTSDWSGFSSSETFERSRSSRTLAPTTGDMRSVG
jgi:hypothetical protein